jgi:hypothetical protein
MLTSIFRKIYYVVETYGKLPSPLINPTCWQNRVGDYQLSCLGGLRQRPKYLRSRGRVHRRDRALWVCLGYFLLRIECHLTPRFGSLYYGRQVEEPTHRMTAFTGWVSLDQHQKVIFNSLPFSLYHAS